MNTALLFMLAITVIAAAARPRYHFRYRARSGAPLQHVRTDFDFTIRASYGIAAPLFGPEAERAWASDDWDPHFLYPQPGRDMEGAVFQVSRGNHRSTWINTIFDLEQGHVQYVYMVPENVVTRIDIHLSQTGPEMTGVRVSYERTALSADANQQVRQAGEADGANGKVWSDDIERYLAAAQIREPATLSAETLNVVV